MEGSESEAVFQSLNLNPQIFINETLNTVDDLLDEAFDFYRQEASTLLKTEGTDRSQQLTEGVAYIRNKIRSGLDTRLGMWEKYCLHHCFSVPKGFSLSKSNESLDESSKCQDALCDPDLDAQLDSLRERLIAVGKESAGLNHELQTLERQSTSTDRCAALVSEASQLYDQNSAHDMFHEMLRMASELRVRMEVLRTRRMENVKDTTLKRISEQNEDLLAASHGKGLSDAKLEDLQQFLSDLKRM